MTAVNLHLGKIVQTIAQRPIRGLVEAAIGRDRSGVGVSDRGRGLGKRHHGASLEQPNQARAVVP